MLRSTDAYRLAVRLLTLAILALAVLLSGPAAAVESSSTEPRAKVPVSHADREYPSLYFFSPDWRPADLGELTAAVEQALNAGGLRVAFQAFTRYEDFEREVAVKSPVFLIGPAWLGNPASTSFGVRFTPIANPVRHARSSYRKALMVRAGVDSIDDLAKGSIAATLHSMGPGSPETILRSFHLDPLSARIVPVPKDVDALLALTFGQVDAALVTSEQYDILATTSPAEAEKLRVLAFSPEVALPPVFAREDADSDLRDRLLAILVRLPKVHQGPQVLAMLGFDGFVPSKLLLSESP